MVDFSCSTVVSWCPSVMHLVSSFMMPEISLVEAPLFCKRAARLFAMPGSAWMPPQPKLCPARPRAASRSAKCDDAERRGRCVSRAIRRIRNPRVAE
nr:hypothetical protein CFP56_07381 [Quercus suber]